MRPVKALQLKTNLLGAKRNGSQLELRRQDEKEQLTRILLE